MHTLDPRPDTLRISPLDEGGFGLTVRWSGGQGIRRASVVRTLLERAQVRARLNESPDGRAWDLLVGPLPAAEVGRVIDEYVF